MITLTREEAQQVLDALELECTDADGKPVDLIAPAIETLRARLAQPEPEEVKWWFMRDNHTFRRLTGTVDEMVGAIAEEIGAGYTSGSLFSRPDNGSIHCNYRETSKFIEDCRAMLLEKNT